MNAFGVYGDGTIVAINGSPEVNRRPLIRSWRDSPPSTACDDGIGISRLRTKLGRPSLSETRLRKFLSALVDAGLAFREDERYLSLAVEARPRECDGASVEGQPESSHITLTEIAVGG
jgi:hypothetical protein